MIRQRLWTVFLLFLAGSIVGTLGTWSLPLGHGFSGFWPALVVQVAGGIFFGGWGIIASVLFPMFTNAMAHVGALGIFGYIPANFAQAFIPAWAFRHYKANPAIPGSKGIKFFLLWGALLPSAVGSCLGSAAVVLSGDASWWDYPGLVAMWGLPHFVVATVIGIPLLRLFAPIWKDLGVVVTGYWDLKSDGSAPYRVGFRDWPITLKLIIAMFGVGLVPLLGLACFELATRTESNTSTLTPLLLTIAIVITTLVVGWLSREIIRPLKELRARVEKQMQGDSAPLTDSRMDEIGEVGRAFETLLQERRRAQASALRDQKLQQFGMLAGGIAHDFNNLLQSIMLNANMARTVLPPDHKGLVFVSNIESISAKGAQVTGELLRFSREQASEPIIVDLNSLAQETSDISRPLLSHDIHFTLALAPVMLLVKANPGHVEQVILNLILNARDAMPTGGRIRVDTGQDLETNRVFLRVTDTGVGIPDSVKAQMFEPYFTTKSPGQGTGLGLAIVSDIVRQYRGEIQVESEVGHGTIFTVYLPSFHRSTRSASL